MLGIIACILAALLLGLYALHQWRVYLDKWYAAEKRCIELEAEVSQLKQDREF